jgi:hypothetical protein
VANRNKANGSAFELLCVKFLATIFGSQVERTLAGSSTDKGDIGGVPELTIECKTRKGGLGDAINAGLLDLPTEQANRGTRWGVVIAKRRGKGQAEDQVVAMPLGQFADLYAVALRGLGYPIKETS